MPLRRESRPRTSLSVPTGLADAISDDRGTYAYSFDHTLVCRRISDLAVLWTHQIPPQLHARQVAVSADGGYVAVASADDAFYRVQQRNYQIAVYDGETGASVALLDLNGSDGMALSPDGRLIAVVAREPGKKHALVPTVYIHEVPSGARLASIVHDAVKRGRRQFLESASWVAFTQRGSYLITYGAATRVWRIER